MIVIISVPLLNYILPLILPEYQNSLTIIPYFLLCMLTMPRAVFLRNVWIQRQEWKNIFLFGLFGALSLLVIFYSFQQIFDTSMPENLALAIFIGQLPYTFSIIIAVSLYIGTIKQTILWTSMFLISVFQVIFILDLNGSINIVDFTHSLTIIQKSFFQLLLFVLTALGTLYLLRRYENLINIETSIQTMKRALLISR